MFTQRQEESCCRLCKMAQSMPSATRMRRVWLCNAFIFRRLNHRLWWSFGLLVFCRIENEPLSILNASFRLNKSISIIFIPNISQRCANAKVRGLTIKISYLYFCAKRLQSKKDSDLSSSIIPSSAKAAITNSNSSQPNIPAITSSHQLHSCLSTIVIICPKEEEVHI